MPEEHSQHSELLAERDSWEARCHFCGGPSYAWMTDDATWNKVRSLLGQSQACFECFGAAWMLLGHNTGEPFWITAAGMGSQSERVDDIRDALAEAMRLGELQEQLETLTQERDTWKVEAEYWSGQARNRAFRNAQEEVGRMVAQRDDLVEQLEAANEYANEGWAWLGAALHALGITHVFEIPDWQENLRKSNAEMAAEKAVAGSYPAEKPDA